MVMMSMMLMMMMAMLTVIVMMMSMGHCEYVDNNGIGGDDVSGISIVRVMMEVGSVHSGGKCDDHGDGEDGEDYDQW